jgi:flagellar biosynthesis/type III secretory pathway protein FliH
LSGAEDGPLRRAVLVWVDRVLMGRGRRQRIPEALGLEDFKVMLENRVEEWNRELREEGRLVGLKEGLKQGRQQGRQKGIEQGLQKGIKAGRQEGIKAGRQEGEALLLLRLLARKFGRLDPQTRKRIRNADAESLLAWGERLLTAERLEDVFGA